MQSELLTPSNERMLQGWKNKGFNEYVQNSVIPDPFNEGCQVAIFCQTSSGWRPARIMRRRLPVSSTPSESFGTSQLGASSSSEKMQEHLQEAAATADADKGEPKC